VPGPFPAFPMTKREQPWERGWEVWSTMVSEVIFRLRILRRIQWCYFVLAQILVPEISRIGLKVKKGCCQKISVTSFSESEFYAESNGGSFVNRLPLVTEIARLGLKVKKGCGQKSSMMSFSESQFYAESNGGRFVTRLPLVPEISRLGLKVKKWVWPKNSTLNSNKIQL
jgi:hypothetical protein